MVLSRKLALFALAALICFSAVNANDFEEAFGGGGVRPPPVRAPKSPPPTRIPVSPPPTRIPVSPPPTRIPVSLPPTRIPIAPVSPPVHVQPPVAAPVQPPVAAPVQPPITCPRPPHEHVVNARLSLVTPLFTRQKFPVDPTLFDISISGNAHNGELVFHIRNPNTTCVPNPTNTSILICGNRAIDMHLYFENRRGIISEGVVINHPSDQNFGIPSNFFAHGTWEDIRGGEAIIDVPYEYTLHIDNKGGPVAEVHTRSRFSGIWNYRTGVFRDAHTAIFAPAYVPSVYNFPYQMVTGFGAVTNDQTNLVLPYRALSSNVPFTGTTPVAPFYVYGNMTNVEFDGAIVRADVEIANVVKTVDIPHGELVGMASRSNLKDCYYLHFAEVNVPGTADSYMLDRTEFCLVPSRTRRW